MAVQTNQRKEKETAVEKDYANPSNDYNTLYKQFVNLERDFKTVTDKLKVEKNRSEQIEEEYQTFKRNNGIGCGISFIFALIAFVGGLFIAGMVDACTTTVDLHNEHNRAITVTRADTYFHHEGMARYKLSTDGAYLVDTLGKYNVGDTIKFNKK